MKEVGFVYRHNKKFLFAGIFVTFVVPPIIYVLKIYSMERTENAPAKDMDRVYASGRRISDIPRAN